MLVQAGTVNRLGTFATLCKGGWARGRALIRDHHHPRAAAEPLPNDLRSTGRSKDLLDAFEVRLSDPIVVSPTETVSMTGRGLI